VIPASSYAILGPTSSSFEYDPRFEPADPWAQRSLLSFCTAIEKDFALEAVKCWPEEFRVWLLQTGHRFPSRHFYAQLEQWDNDPSAEPSNLTGYDSYTGTMVMTTVTIYPRILTLSSRDTWKAWIADWNSRAPLTANYAYPTASKWKGAATEKALVQGSLETIFFVSGTAFVCTILSTFSCCLSIVSVLLVLMIVLLLFFMICIMGWTLGPIELLGIIFFVGYTASYPLHVVHSFCHVSKDSIAEECMAMLPSRKAHHECHQDDASVITWSEARRVKVIIALRQIGGAVVCSTISICGVGFFLFFAQINLLLKFGIMLVAVSLLSLIMVLTLFPAILLVLDLECICCIRCARYLFGCFKCVCRSKQHSES